MDQVLELKFPPYTSELLALPPGILKALHEKKRGLAVSLYLQQFPSTDLNAALVAGNYIDTLLDRYKDSIESFRSYKCCGCGKEYLPLAIYGRIFLYHSTTLMVCKACEAAHYNEQPDILPPPYEDWPSWAKEAFGPKTY